ncbi:MAG: hypothetical protein COA60_009225 [Robiginitomaculum sp.]|nr:hypothetical protein [Robiginitomaculum sp.]
MKAPNRIKLIIGLILAVGVLWIVFKDTLFKKLVYDEITITTGCMIEVCVGDSKTETIEAVKAILDIGNTELLYKVTNIPTHSPDDLNYEKLMSDDLWTLFVQKRFGITSAYYLYFDGNSVSKIKVVKYGLLYFDL